MDGVFDCSVRAISTNPPCRRHGSNHAVRRHWPNAGREQAKPSEKSDLDALFPPVRHSFRAGHSACAVKSKVRSSGGCTPARCVDGGYLGEAGAKPALSRNCDAVRCVRWRSQITQPAASGALREKGKGRFMVRLPRAILLDTSKAIRQSCVILSASEESRDFSCRLGKGPRSFVPQDDAAFRCLSTHLNRGWLVPLL